MYIKEHNDVHLDSCGAFIDNYYGFGTAVGLAAVDTLLFNSQPVTTRESTGRRCF